MFCNVGSTRLQREERSLAGSPRASQVCVWSVECGVRSGVGEGLLQVLFGGAELLFVCRGLGFCEGGHLALDEGIHTSLGDRVRVVGCVCVVLHS